MEKIINKDFRQTKSFKLPTSGITVEMYSSALVKDTSSSFDPGVSDFDKNFLIIVRVIKAWNLFEKETDDKPVAITPEAVKSLPATDFEWLLKEFTDWANEVKKNLRT